MTSTPKKAVRVWENSVVLIPSKIKFVLFSGIACCSLAVSAGAQERPSNEVIYANLLQQIADKKLEIGRTEVFLAGQKDEEASLRKQLAELDDTKKSIVPMIEKMTAAIENAVAADYPFDMDARQPRLTRLRELVNDEKATPGAKMRRALNVYKIEVNYGQGLEAYQGNHPVEPTVRTGDDRYKKDENGEILRDDDTGVPIEEFDGNYLRYGRLAYVYLNENGTDPYRYDLPTRSWVELPAASAADIRRAIRVSRGEAAPTVVKVPVFNEAGE